MHYMCRLLPFSGSWWIPSLRILIVIVGWWVAYCLTSIKVKEALNEDEETVSDVTSAFRDLRWIDLTALQLLIEAIVMKFWLKIGRDFSKHDNRKRDKVITPVLFWHIVGHLATNAAFASVSSSMTLVTTNCEPLFAITVAFLYSETTPNAAALLSVIVMCNGARMFVNADESFNVWGICAALTSNIMFPLRNAVAKSKTDWEGAIQHYPVLSMYGFLLIFPVVLLKMAVTQEFPQLEPTESLISATSYVCHSIASVTTFTLVVPWAYDILDQGKRIFAIIINLLYFQTPNGVLIYEALFVFSVGSILYGLRNVRVKIRKTFSVVAMVICLVHVTLWNPEHADVELQLHHHIKQLDCQHTRIITTSWIYDRPIPEEIVKNINDIHNRYPDKSIDVYCGTSQCVGAINHINNSNIKAHFLSIDTVVRDLPLYEWLVQHPVNKILAGAMFEDHLQYVVQLGLLWQRGGIYVNPELVLDLTNVTRNPWIVGSKVHEASYTSTYGMLDASCFTRHSFFIRKLAGRFVRTYPKALKDQAEWPIHFNLHKLQFELYKDCQDDDNCPVMLDLNLDKVTYPNRNRNSYGSLAVDSHRPGLQYANLGLVCQGFVDIQFLPFVDIYLQRDQLAQSKRESNITVFFSGLWSGQGTDWPPPNNIHPEFTSVHTEQQMQATMTKYIDYARSKSPIGCSDISTLQFFNRIGVAAYFSGDIALMMRNPYHGRAHTNKVYLVDVTDDVNRFIPLDVLNKATKIVASNGTGDYNGNQLARLVEAHDHLKMYANAKLVITQGIHSALLSAAMGTPVVFINFKNVTEMSEIKYNVHSPDKELTALFHTLEVNTTAICTSKIASWVRDFNWQNPPPNPNPNIMMKLRTTLWNGLRKNQHLYDAARKFGMLPITSLPDSSFTLSFHLIFTTTQTSLITQCSSQEIVVSGKFNWAHMRVVESILYHHPSAKVTIHSNTLPQDTFDVLTESGYSIRVQAYNLSEMIKESPASAFTDQMLEEAMKGPHWYSHETDFLRTLIMHKYGGIYMDTDMMLVKPVNTLGPNILAYQRKNDVNGAFMKFEKGNEFIYECLKLLPRIYTPLDWIIAGPGLLTKVWNVYRTRNVTEQPIQVLKRNSFYMFDDQHILTTCFQDTNGTKFNMHMSVLRREAYAVHTNSKITASALIKNRLKGGTICKYVFNKFCVLCNELH